MKKFHCNIPIGFEFVELYTDPEIGGAHLELPHDPRPGEKRGKLAGVITIGLHKHDTNLAGVLFNLMHEIMEYTLIQMGCRFAQDNVVHPTTDNFIFVASHQQYAEAVARATHGFLRGQKYVTNEFHKLRTPEKPKRNGNNKNVLAVDPAAPSSLPRVEA